MARKPKTETTTEANPVVDATAATAPRPRASAPGKARAAGASPRPTKPARQSTSESSREDDAEPRDDSEEPDARDEVLVGEVAADEAVDTDLPEVALPPEKGDRGLARFDPFTAYFNEVQHHPLLKPEEEHALAVQYAQSQDVNAAARLVTSNLRLVVKIAYEYRRAYRNMMDLIQEGNIGLMQAVKRYDPYRGVKLSSYAAWWIRAYILRFILNNWRLVKIGTTQAQRKLFFNLNKERQKLLAMGINPTAGELAKRLDVQETEVTEMDRRLSGSDVSLDAPVGDGDGRPTSRIDLLPGVVEGADEALSSEELGQMLRTHLATFEKTLQGKEATIFHDRLMAEDPVTLQEIGDRYGISRERVRQLEARLQDKLKTFLQSHMGEAIPFG